MLRQRYRHTKADRDREGTSKAYRKKTQQQRQKLIPEQQTDTQTQINREKQTSRQQTGTTTNRQRNKDMKHRRKCRSTEK